MTSPQAKPGLVRQRSSLSRMSADLAIKPAWANFLEASTVEASVNAYQTLRTACGVSADADGRRAFDGVQEATSVSQVPHRTKSLMQALAENWKLRPVSHGATRLLISGAGPVGLRAAVEAALLGMRVHVIEKREVFSRVNILMLWQPTADDLISYGARTFYPKFTNRNIGTSPLHLGTREIQLVLLKNALLLGVTFSYGTELVGVQAPAPAGSLTTGEDGSWLAWAKVSSKETHQTKGGVLDFKPNKTGAYSKGTGMGKCNQLQASELDASFALRADEMIPPNVVTVPFEALLLAEGEWSETCSKLGVTKSVDRFSQAIGLVINMVIDPKEPRTKDPNMRSYVITPIMDVGRQLLSAGIKFEFGEYLKGETHYIVVVITKSSLLSSGSLREDLPGKRLLTKANLDVDALLSLSRRIATIVGLPDTTEFTSFHPAKLFDFSTRARAIAPFRVLDVASGGSRQGEVVAADLEAQTFLREQESLWMSRALAASEAEVAKRKVEIAELEEAITQTSANLASMKAGLEAAADDMLAKAMAHAQPFGHASEKPAMLRRASTGVQDDEWDDDYDDPPPQQMPTQAELAEQRKEEYGVKSTKSEGGEDAEVEEARLVAYKRSLAELKEKLREGFVDANRTKRSEWEARCAASPRIPPGKPAGKPTTMAPVFPIGDSLLEPFWPQGLGSNRGFHSALDAVWAVHVMEEEGLEAALLERCFWYDLMLQGPWKPALLKPAAASGGGVGSGRSSAGEGGGWSADPLTRYADGAIVRTKANYTNPQSKRLFRGDEATPARIRALSLSGTRGFM